MLLALTAVAAINATDNMVVTSSLGLSIRGTVEELQIQIPCRIRLFEKLTGRLIADVATDDQGGYEFNHLTKVAFFLVAHHPSLQFNAVIQDNVVPK